MALARQRYLELLAISRLENATQYLKILNSHHLNISFKETTRATLHAKGQQRLAFPGLTIVHYHINRSPIEVELAATHSETLHKSGKEKTTVHGFGGRPEATGHCSTTRIPRRYKSQPGSKHREMSEFTPTMRIPYPQTMMANQFLVASLRANFSHCNYTICQYPNF